MTIDYRRGNIWILTESDLDAFVDDAVEVTAERDRLKAAVVAFLRVWPEAEKQINGTIALQSVRAGRDTYTGPSLVNELAGLRAALKEE